MYDNVIKCTYFKVWISMFIKRANNAKVACIGVYHFSQCCIPKIQSNDKLYILNYVSLIFL